jgi:hypothetical protein
MPCRHCDSTKHPSYFCPSKPKIAPRQYTLNATPASLAPEDFINYANYYFVSMGEGVGFRRGQYPSLIVGTSGLNSCLGMLISGPGGFFMTHIPGDVGQALNAELEKILFSVKILFRNPRLTWDSFSQHNIKVSLVRAEDVGTIGVEEPLYLAVSKYLNSVNCPFTKYRNPRFYYDLQNDQIFTWRATLFPHLLNGRTGDTHDSVLAFENSRDEVIPDVLMIGNTVIEF